MPMTCTVDELVGLLRQSLRLLCPLMSLGLGCALVPGLRAAEANDLFKNRSRISSDQASLSSNSVGATRETGEPLHAGVAGGASLWWQWTPDTVASPQGGYVVIDTAGSDFDTLLGVYFGKSFDQQFDVIASNDNAPGLKTSRVGFDALPAVDYSIAIDGRDGAAGPLKLNLRLYTLPEFLRQPDSIERIEGESAVFSVDVLGKTPLVYQWQHAGTNLPGQTGSELRIAALRKVDEGSYRVVVRNGYGQVNSASANLVVLPGPKIVSNPKGANPEPGSTVTLSVEAVGSPPLAYQWFYIRNSGSTPTPIAGGNSPSLVLENISTDQAGSYTVRVSNGATAVTSSPAVVVVDPLPPRIVTQPVTVIADVGSDAVFQGDVAGHRPIAWQWFFRDPKAGAAKPILGATIPRLIVTSVDPTKDGFYSFSVSNRYGITLSQEARLAVQMGPANDLFVNQTPLGSVSTVAYGYNRNATAELGEPSHAGQPARNSVWWSFQPTELGFLTLDLAGSTIDTVLAVYTGTNLTQLKPIVSNDDGWNPATGQILAQSRVSLVAEAGRNYLIAVDGKNGQAADSAANGNRGGLVLSVVLTNQFPLPVLTNQLPEMLLLPGTRNGEVGCGTQNYSIDAGGLLPIVHRWQFNLRALTSEDLEGKKAQDLGVPPGLKNLLGPNSWLGVARTAGESWVDIPGATNKTLTLTELSMAQTGQFRVIVSNQGVPGSVTSAPSTLVVSPLPILQKHPTGFTNRECDLSKPLEITVKDGCYPQTVEWYYNGNRVANQAKSRFAFERGWVDESGEYQAVVRNAAGSTTSRVAQVVFDPTPAFVGKLTLSASKVFDCETVLAEFNYAPRCRTTTIEWFLDGRPIPGAAEDVLIFDAEPQSAGNYTVRISNEFGSVTSDPVALAVDPSPVVLTQPGTGKLRRVLIGTAFTNTVRIGSCRNLTFEWRKDGQPLVPRGRIEVVPVTNPGSDQTTCQLIIRSAQLSDSGNYDVVVRSANGLVTSRSAAVQVMLPPPNDFFASRLALSNTLSTLGGSNYFTSMALGSNYFGTAESGEPVHAGQNPLHSVWWTWKSPAPSLVTVNLEGSDFDTLLSVFTGAELGSLTPITNNDNAGGKITSRVSFLAARNRVFQIAVDGRRGDLEEGLIRMSVQAEEIVSPPIILYQPRHVAVRQGENASFSIGVWGSPDIQFQWQFKGQSIPGATNSTLQIRNAQPANEGEYQVLLSNEYGSTNSWPVQLTLGTIVVGQVTDATTSLGVPAAKVSVGPYSAVTDSAGNFLLIGPRSSGARVDFDSHKRRVRLNEPVRFNNLSTDSRVLLRCEKDGYSTYEDRQFEAPPGQYVTNRVILSPLTDGLRMVLGWGQIPADLDLHLLVPPIDGKPRHVQYIDADRGRLDAPPFARLDVDIQDGFGPETITVSRLFDGIYRVYAKKFDPASPGPMAGSRATLRVYNPNGLLGVREVPTTGTGSVWHVADYDTASGVLVWADQIQTGDPTWPTRIIFPSDAGSTVTNKPVTPSGEAIAGAAYLWDFGDGQTSAEYAPSHAYKKVGSYTVRLTLNAPGIPPITETKDLFITAYNEPPVVALTEPKPEGLVRAGVPFMLQARAEDFDGSVARVEFYRVEAGASIGVGQVLSGPFALEHPALAPGRYEFFARAFDDLGATTDSARVGVEVVDLDGDILLISRASDVETDVVLNYLIDLGIPDGPFAFRSPNLRITTPDTLRPEILRHFKLVLWDDLGALENAPTDKEVQLLVQLRSMGIPLYLIGEHLAANSVRLTEAASLWQALTQIAPIASKTSTGPIGFLDPDRDRPRFGTEYGTVSGFSYPNPTEATVLLEEELDVVLEREGRPVMMSGPRVADPDLGDSRVVSQDFLVAVGSEWDSLAERRALFLNAASWLMRLGDCDSLGLEVTTDRIPSSIGVGQVVRVATDVIQVGGCDRGAILFSNLISSGFEVVGFQVESVEPSNATNLVRMERTSDGVLTRFARTKDPVVFRLVYDLVPMQTGFLTNHMAIRFNPYYAAQPVAEQVFSVGTSDCASQIARVAARVTLAGALELVVAGSGSCTFQIQTSSDLQNWKPSADVTPSISGTVVPLGAVDSELRFYRVIPKP